MDKEDMADTKAGIKQTPAEEKADKKKKKPSGKNYSPQVMMMAKQQMAKGMK